MNKKNNNILKIALISIAVILVIITGSVLANKYFFQSTTNTPTITDQTSPKTTAKNVITFNGKDGETALALLQKAANIKTSGEGENAFVTTINGVTADSNKKQYWSFTINGTPSSVGVGSYTTKSSDIIKLELATF